jgi:hypothetical protein
MKGFFRVLEGLYLFSLVFRFFEWFVRGLFGKYFYVFWVWLIIVSAMYFIHQSKIESEYDHRTGAEVWEAQYGKVN